MYDGCHVQCRGLENSPELKEVEQRVQEFGGSFAMPGFDVSSLKYSNGHSANVLANGFGDSNGLPRKGSNSLSTSTAFDPKVEHADIAN